MTAKILTSIKFIRQIISKTHKKLLKLLQAESLYDDMMIILKFSSCVQQICSIQKDFQTIFVFPR